jgi:hypothetical protein
MARCGCACPAALLILLLAPAPAPAEQLEQRNEVSYLRGSYNWAQFYNQNDSYRYSAAFHFHHGKQHDILQLTPLDRHEQEDEKFNEAVVRFLRRKTARIEPTMELYGPYTAQFAFRVYRAIDWTHMHHEQTYDILSHTKIPWSEKQEWTDRAVRYYLDMNRGVARSIAPLDITMRRAAVMMKPYFTYYRNYYPKSNSFAWVAHWWHPVIYEGYMIAGNNKQDQSRVLDEINVTMFREVLIDRPHRMLLSREIMPRYSRLSPESANIFDNLHMLHGIVYDILAYEGWTRDQKRAELYRFIDAMSYQPGDEKYVRKFPLPHADIDPRIYYDWMKPAEGEMNRIMREMMQEMMPLMMPDGMAPQMHEKVMAQFKMKMTDGLQEGEIPGSLHDAMMQLMPHMRMDPESMEPGKTPHKMVAAMLQGWQDKYGSMPDVEPYPMDHEPTPPPPLNQGASR